MAETTKKVIEIDIDVESGDVSKVSKEVEGIDKNIKKAEKGTKGLSNGFKKIGTAIKAAGIGLLIAALGTLVEVFKTNQGAIDGFETGLTALKIAFNDLFGYISKNVGAVTGYFKSIFEDPKQALKDFGAAIKENLIERFNSFLDTLGYIASAVKKLFSSDFAGALDDVKKAGKESLDVLTGVNNSFDKASEFIGDAVEAITDYTTATLASAKATVELGKASELAAIKQQGLIEQFDRAAEIQRQIRDDETKSFAERIAANERLGEILKEQIKAETALINIQERAIRDKLSKGLIPEFEAQKQLLELQNERAAILAKVTGLESEQLINRNSLLREQAQIQDDIQSRAIEKQQALDDISLQIMQDGMDKELMLSSQKYDKLYEQATGNAELQRQITEAQEREAFDITKKYADQALEAEKKRIADEKAMKEAAVQATSNVVKAGIDSAMQLNDALVANQLITAKKGFQISKALSIASAAINTAEASIAAYKSVVGIPYVGPVLAPIAAGVAVAAGVAQIGLIAAQKFNPSSGGGGGGAVPTAASGGGRSPNFNTVGGSQTNQLANSIAGQNQKPVKAYVVSTDMTNEQQLDRKAKTKSSFG
jgi:hypothetical protein